MFTGIIEEVVPALKVTERNQAIEIEIQRPQSFDDLKVGDSIATNGVCLTVESFDDQVIRFTIGFETLQVTGWTLESLKGRLFNLERSLRFGDRIHGHMVSGHVDTTAKVQMVKPTGDCLILVLELPEALRREVWKKSSLTINGVSLTVNHIDKEQFEVCLVPETLRKTNLAQLTEGEPVNLETDYYMKGLLNAQGVLNA